MAFSWTGKGKETPEPSNSGGETKPCTKCNNGKVTVKSAKTIEHGGFEDYEDDCSTCGGTGQVSK